MHDALMQNKGEAKT